MQKVSLYLMVVLYLVAGINHFVHPSTYMAIMPAWIPWPMEAVFVSGVAEIILALLLIPVLTRIWAAWLIILLLIAIFPANIQMTINYYKSANPNYWLTIARLPLQLLLIWWAYSFTKRKVN